MDDFSPEYKAACATLRDRLVDFCRSHPEIIAENVPDSEIFMSLADFDVSDIGPSLAMMDAAWDAAREILAPPSMAEIVGE